MNRDGRPKQFLELRGKPIIIYTLEIFERHPEIDAIVVACVEDWIPYMQDLIKKYELKKVVNVVPGGTTGQDSIFSALDECVSKFPKDSIVLIHDGVRPLINAQTITDNIECVQSRGSCITCVPTIETFIISNSNDHFSIPDRKDSLIARAPQSFRLGEIYSAHIKARKEGKHDFIDSCSMMNHYGQKLATVMGPIENIKITTPMDYFVFKTMFEVNETREVFGI